MKTNYDSGFNMNIYHLMHTNDIACRRNIGANNDINESSVINANSRLFLF